MEKVKLSLKESMPAAKIFLNIFGLVLDEDNTIKCNGDAVGNLFIVDDTIYMKANYNDAVLNASFNIPKGYGFVDTEDNNALFGEWKIPITFDINSNNIKYDGSILFDCTADSEFGLNCLIHPEIIITSPDDKKINVKMQKDFNFFRFDISKDDYYEYAFISPWNDLSGYLMHQITKGKEVKYAFPYNFQAGIYPGAEVGERKNLLHVFLSERERNGEEEKYLSFHNEFVPRVAKDDTAESNIQKGLLMQKLDKAMYEKIELIRKLLTIGNVSILDNLVGACYNSYSDEEVHALLGINREKMKYQTEANNLREAYFDKNLLENIKIKKFKN